MAQFLKSRVTGLNVRGWRLGQQSDGSEYTTPTNELKTKCEELEVSLEALT